MASGESFYASTHANTLKHRLILSCRKVAVTSPGDLCVRKFMTAVAFRPVGTFGDSTVGVLDGRLAVTKRPSGQFGETRAPRSMMPGADRIPYFEDDSSA